MAHKFIHKTHQDLPETTASDPKKEIFLGSKNHFYLQFRPIQRAFILGKVSILNQEPVFYICNHWIYHLFSNWSNPDEKDWIFNYKPVHEDVFVITEWFLAKKARIQEMGLVFFKSCIIKPAKSRRSVWWKWHLSQTSFSWTIHRPWDEVVVLVMVDSGVVLVVRSRERCKWGWDEEEFGE